MSDEWWASPPTGTPVTPTVPSGFDRAPVPPAPPVTPPPYLGPPPVAIAADRERETSRPSPSAGRVIGGAAAGIVAWAALAFVADWMLDRLELWNQPQWIGNAIYGATELLVALVGLCVAFAVAGFIGSAELPRFVLVAAGALTVLTVVTVLFDLLDLYEWQAIPTVGGMAIASIALFGHATNRRGGAWFFPPLFNGVGWLVVFTVLAQGFDWFGYYGRTWIVVAATTVTGLLAATVLATRDRGAVAAPTTPGPAVAAMGAAPPPIYYDQQGRPVVIAPAAPSTNGLAIASLILGLCGLGVPAVVCGHIALSQIRRSGGMQEGRGIAIGGLVAGYIAIALVVALWIVMLALA